MASVIYSGTFGSVSAGSAGISVPVTGTPIPSNATITDIAYTLAVSADKYSASKNWVLHWFAIGSTSGTPIVSNQSAAMASNKHTFGGSMYFVASDVSKFTSGEFTLYAKANCNYDAASSFMGAFSITVAYEVPTACGVPSNVKLSPTTSTGDDATLSWTAGSAGHGNAITGYEVQRAESTDGSTWGSWATLTTTAATKISISARPPSTAGNYYKYRVRTLGEAGSSYYSGWVESSNTLRRMWTACGVPSNVKLSATTSYGEYATLSWTAGKAGHGNAVTGYEVQRAESTNGSTWGSWATLTTTAADKTTMSARPPSTPGNYYKYRVRTLGEAGSSYYSGWVESSSLKRNPPDKCTEPSGVKLSSATSTGNNVTLSWTAGKGGNDNAFSYYQVARKLSTDGKTFGTVEMVKTTTETSLSVAPPVPYGSYYRYYVRTVGTAGISYASSWATCSSTLQKVRPKLTAYTDTTITAGTTPVKAVHMTELQSNINALRQGLGLAAYSFTAIKAGYTGLGAWNAHIREMRTAIDGITTSHEAWLKLGENRPRADVLMQLRRVVASI